MHKPAKVTNMPMTSMYYDVCINIVSIDTIFILKVTHYTVCPIDSIEKQVVNIYTSTATSTTGII